MNRAITTEDLIKSLESLSQTLEKSQIQTGKGHQPKSWEGGNVEEEDDDSEITQKNGTDFKKGCGAFSEDDDEDDMEKSNTFEVNDFIEELTKSVVFYLNRLEAKLEKSIRNNHAQNGRIVATLADNLEVLGNVVQKSQGNIRAFSQAPARGPKSVRNSLEKSQTAGTGQLVTTDDVMPLLMKGFEDGRVDPLLITKVEMYGPGVIPQELLKSLTA